MAPEGSRRAPGTGPDRATRDRSTTRIGPGGKTAIGQASRCCDPGVDAIGSLLPAAHCDDQSDSQARSEAGADFGSRQGLPAQCSRLLVLERFRWPVLRHPERGGMRGERAGKQCACQRLRRARRNPRCCGVATDRRTNTAARPWCGGDVRGCERAGLRARDEIGAFLQAIRLQGPTTLRSIAAALK